MSTSKKDHHEDSSTDKSGDATIRDYRTPHGHFKFIGEKLNSDGIVTDFRAAEVHFNRVASLGLDSGPPLSYVSGLCAPDVRPGFMQAIHQT